MEKLKVIAASVAASLCFNVGFQQQVKPTAMDWVWL